jgi:two-component system chemotaxis response regulator CheB
MGATVVHQATGRPLESRTRIRVLVVDDSVVIRRLVTHALEQEPSIEVVGAAANGAIALTKVSQLNPDVITLDVEMPEVDGLEMLRQLRRQNTHVRVIMFSTLTRRGATATIDALMAGADDYVTKAANVGSLDESMAALRSELVPRIKQFFRIESRPSGGAPGAGLATSTPLATPASRLATASRKVLAIGVSTGGPIALAEVVAALPAIFPLPILIVQHMPPLFTKFLAERLQKLTALRVCEAWDTAAVAPGTIYIAPGGYHMRVKKANGKVVLALDQEPPENSCRPAVDVLFRSVCEVYGGATISVVLTGMGQDGLRGVEALHPAGAYVIAQDEASSVVWGMPGAVARAGLADAVVPLADVVPEILKQV